MKNIGLLLIVLAIGSFQSNAQKTPLVACLKVGQISCFGSNDGNISVDGQGGSAPYYYSWSDGSTNPVLLGLGPGIYSGWVIDTAGDSIELFIELNEPLELTASASVTNVSEMGAGDGAIDLTVSGGTGNYSFSWSNGQLIQNIANLNGGTYTCNVVDEHGCDVENTAEVLEPAFINPVSTTNTAASIMPGQGGGAYPNPSEGDLRIPISTDVIEVSIFNQLGFGIYKFSTEDQDGEALNVQLDKGRFYIIYSTKDGQKITENIIVR